MIFASSRYAGNSLAAIGKDGQAVSVILPAPPAAQTFSYISHSLTVTDRLDNLANQYYGDPLAWWVIANANPELIDWTALVPGTVLRIPFR